jgi:8-oxo-dGTP pyrophosphatase MutT (NUDIX family)
MTEAVPVPTRDAATVILARQPAAGKWQCFMVRRHVSSDFAPDVYVFPGGKVDAADRDPEIPRYIDTAILPPTEVEFADRDLGFRMAALRELFEEAGVLLAVGRDHELVGLRGDQGEKFEAWRTALRDGTTKLVALAEETGIRYLPGQLVPLARWITPLSMPRRYDTRFFVAAMPDGQRPLHDAIETTHGTWISPRDALEQSRTGDFPLVFATIKNLERLARFDTIAELIAGVTPGDLEPIMPKMVERDGKTEFLVPGDAGYRDV